MLLHETMERSARERPEAVALVCGTRRLLYRDINLAAARLGATLQRAGVGRGDRVAIFLDNSPETVIAIYAALKIGAAFVPINALTKPDKLAQILRDAEPAAVITEPRHRADAARACAALGSFRIGIVRGGQALEAANWIAFDLACVGRDLPSDAGTIDQDLAAIIYTSGSTGAPKGVMLSHLNMVSAARSIVTYLGLRAQDVIFCALPLAFDYGLYQVLMAFQVGACVVLETAFAFAIKALHVMEREAVTVFPGVPTMFSMVMNIDAAARPPLPALRMITNTAAALSEEHVRRLRASFPGAQLFSMYGLTECKRVTYLPPAELDRRPTSVGRGMPNEEVYLVDDAGRRLPNGSIGQLVVRGSHVMRGYWRKPAESAQRLRPGPLPGENILYTGDIFRTDAEGYLYFVARSDDIIKSRGEKVSPKEVENALYGLDGVVEAAVIGVPDELLGEAVKAWVVLKDGYRYTEREVIKHCQTRLENFMAPKHVVFMSSLPKTHNGKIDKMQLATGDADRNEADAAPVMDTEWVKQGAKST